MLLRFTLDTDSPTDPKPEIVAWVALSTGNALTPPVIDDPSRAGLWGYWWDAAKDGDAEGWVSFGGASPRLARISATGESGRILSGGLSTGWGVVNVSP